MPSATGAISQSLWVARSRCSYSPLHVSVYPGGSVGVHDWTYVPPLADVGLDQAFEMGTDVSIPKVLDAVFAMYDPEVITPMVAWLVAALNRPLFETFPILFISGTSGTGKTSLIEAVLPAITGSLIETNLTSTTPHAMAAFFGSSTSFPVWFDEYRPGMKRDTKMLFDQLLRDSYNGKRSSKGGQNANNLSAITAFDTAVPVIVSGEDSITETSLTDRSIQLRLTVKRQGKLSKPPSLAFSMLTKILSDALGSTLSHGKIRVVPEGPDSLPVRQRLNLGTIRAGWTLLEGVVFPEYTLPDLDLSLVIEKGEEAAKESPIEDAITYALEEQLDCVFIKDDRVHIMADAFLREIVKADVHMLPVSNARGIKEFLKDKYGAKQATATTPLGVRAVTQSFPCGRIEL